MDTFKNENFETLNYQVKEDLYFLDVNFGPNKMKSPNHNSDEFDFWNLEKLSEKSNSGFVLTAEKKKDFKTGESCSSGKFFGAREY